MKIQQHHQNRTEIHNNNNTAISTALFIRVTKNTKGSQSQIHRKPNSLGLVAKTAQATFSAQDRPDRRVVMLQPYLRDSPTRRSSTSVVTRVWREKPGSMRQDAKCPAVVHLFLFRLTKARSSLDRWTNSAMVNISTSKSKVSPVHSTSRTALMPSKGLTFIPGITKKKGLWHGMERDGRGLE